jgi:hypothetical protein
MPERSQSGFSFAINFLRRVEAWFEAEAMTSNAGGLLLRETDRRLNLLPRPVRLFLGGRIDQPRAEIVLDLDRTDVERHGGQEGRSFHGSYDEYCCRPLYIFCGEHLLRLRQADIDAPAGSSGGSGTNHDADS